jgi:hypothetical protein
MTQALDDDLSPLTRTAVPTAAGALRLWNGLCPAKADMFSFGHPHSRSSLPPRLGFLATCSAYLIALTGIACGASSPTAPSTTPITATGTGATTLTYTTDVQPILSADCVRCHGASQQSGGYNLSTYAGVLRALTAGSDSSSLVRVTQPGGLMYSNLSGNRTTKAGVIYDWVVNSKAAQ